VNNYSLTTEYAWYKDGKKDPVMVISTVIINGGYHKKFILWDGSANTGIADLNKKISLQLGPNPARNWLYIQAGPSNKNGTLSITDLWGRLVHTYGMPSSGLLMMDLSNFETGSYFMRLENENGVAVKQFIKE
jgi:hypothetical protein